MLPYSCQTIMVISIHNFVHCCFSYPCCVIPTYALWQGSIDNASMHSRLKSLHPSQQNKIITGKLNFFWTWFVLLPWDLYQEKNSAREIKNLLQSQFEQFFCNADTFSKTEDNFCHQFGKNRCAACMFCLQDLNFHWLTN